MHIIFFLTFDYSFKLWEKSGNLSREIMYLNEFQKKSKCKFYFVSYGNSDEKKYEKYLNNSEIIPVYQYFKFVKNKIFRHIISIFIPFYLYKIFKNKNIDLLKQNQIQGAWISILLKILLKKPLIIRTGYDAFSFKIFEKKNFLIKTFYYVITFFGLKFSDLYTVTSNSDLKFLKKYFRFSDNKLRIRQNFVNVYISKSIENRLPNSVITVGRLEIQKNYEYLIKELKNQNLKIDHYGTGSQLNNLKKISKNTNLNINFNKGIDNLELCKKYENYKFFISTSFFEGNSKAILEAMAAGCIVFASKNPNNIEIINHGVNGFLFELNNNDLLNIFSIVKNDSNLTKKISSEAIKTVEKINSLEFLIQNELEDVLNLIDGA